MVGSNNSSSVKPPAISNTSDDVFDALIEPAEELASQLHEDASDSDSGSPSIRDVFEHDLLQTFAAALEQEPRLAPATRFALLRALAADNTDTDLNVTVLAALEEATLTPFCIPKPTAMSDGALKDRLAYLKYTAFRGLPAYSLTMKGRNVAIFGGNGSGKSGIVDGIEFFFSGELSAFQGRGTGGIRLVDVLKHIGSELDPEVSGCFKGVNEAVTRTVSQGPTSEAPTIAQYLRSHPSCDAFILRRRRLQQFFDEPGADRYQRLVRLLGLERVDVGQAALVSVEATLQADLEKSRAKLERLLAPVSPPGQDPLQSSKQLLESVSADLKAIGASPLEKWTDLDARIAELDDRRSPETRRRMNKLNEAVSLLRRPVNIPSAKDLERANALRAVYVEHERASEDGPRKQVLDAALEHLQSAEYSDCPVCLQLLPNGYDAFMVQLATRLANLQSLSEAEQRWVTTISELKRTLARLRSQLCEEAHGSRLSGDDDGRGRVIAVRLQLRKWVREHSELLEARKPVALEELPDLQGLVQARGEILKELQTSYEELLEQDTAALEHAFSRLQTVHKAIKDILEAEEQIATQGSLVDRARIAKSAFTKAREGALNKLLDRIGTLVLEYYEKLHAPAGSGQEISECTEVSLKPSGRSQRGGLELRIRFFEMAEQRDPRPYLSEGHLDSLGLCIYLASVKLFNPPGSLLVLDDVLTSIDQQHRMRVITLLLTEFAEYQLVLTTHDEWWFERLQDAIGAVGRNGDWRFTHIARWTLEGGPESFNYERTWERIDAALASDAHPQAFQDLGGPLRVVFEDFLKRTAERLQCKVHYKIDARYTSGDFLGLQGLIKKKLIGDPHEEEKDIDVALINVFSSSLVNALSHDKVERLSVARKEVEDFVAGLKELRRRCVAAKAIKGPVA